MNLPDRLRLGLGSRSERAALAAAERVVAAV
jgi:hypothetical protein